MIFRSETPQHRHVVTVSLASGRLHVGLSFRYEPFRELMHAERLRWDGLRWTRLLDFRTGDPLDRAAEMAHILLEAGFPVDLPDEEASRRAETGEYADEHRRWIALSAGYGAAKERAGWLLFSWGPREDYAAKIRTIHGAGFFHGAMVAPPAVIEEVADFAATEGFRLSPSAERMLVERREQLAQGIVIAPRNRAEPAPKKLRSPLIPVPCEVADEFRD